jgi:uncharacterized protein YukE
MGLLKFDFNKANAQIQELEEIASEIDQLAATDYENLMQQMRSAWKGNAADKIQSEPFSGKFYISVH